MSGLVISKWGMEGSSPRSGGGWYFRVSCFLEHERWGFPTCHYFQDRRAQENVDMDIIHVLHSSNNNGSSGSHSCGSIYIQNKASKGNEKSKPHREGEERLYIVLSLVLGYLATKQK